MWLKWGKVKIGSMRIERFFVRLLGMGIRAGLLTCFIAGLGSGCQTVEESGVTQKGVVVRNRPVADIRTRRPKMHTPRRPPVFILGPSSRTVQTERHSREATRPGMAKTDDLIVQPQVPPRHPSEILTSDADESVDHVVRTNIPTERVPTTNVNRQPGDQK